MSLKGEMFNLTIYNNRLRGYHVLQNAGRRPPSQSLRRGVELDPFTTRGGSSTTPIEMCRKFSVDQILEVGLLKPLRWRHLTLSLIHI